MTISEYLARPDVVSTVLDNGSISGGLATKAVTSREGLRYKGLAAPVRKIREAARRGVMKRRTFLTSATAGVAAGAGLAAPALAQSAGAVRWRMTTSWPKSLDTIHGSAEALGKRVSQLTGGQFGIRVFAGGEIVPPRQVLAPGE